MDRRRVFPSLAGLPFIGKLFRAAPVEAETPPLSGVSNSTLYWTHPSGNAVQLWHPEAGQWVGWPSGEVPLASRPAPDWSRPTNEWYRVPSDPTPIWERWNREHRQP